MNFKQYFNTLLEARQEEIDKIRDAVDKVSDRPFGELFGGKGDRFLIKVYNPQFEKSAKALGLDISKFDWTKRTYDGQNINSFLNNKKRDLANIKPDKSDYAEVKKTYKSAYQSALKFNWDPKSHARDAAKNHYQDLIADGGHYHNIKYYTKKHINGIKQAIDQQNIYYYLLFSRHPVDVLRMSDHKGISSCHRLQGSYSKDQGEYAHCALADARNDGGIVYLIKGGDAKRIKDHLDEQDVFEDKDRSISGIRPLGRIRLRRFIDLQTGDDFAVPTTLQDEQKYGIFTNEIYQVVLKYCQAHQEIVKNPPTWDYLAENVVLVGGSYSDEDLGFLLSVFLKKAQSEYGAQIKHKSKHMTTWEEEISKILSSPDLKTLKIYKITHAFVVSGNKIDFRYEVNTVLPDQAVQKIRNPNKPQSFNKDVTTVVNLYFGQNQFVVGISAQTVSSPPTWKEQDGKILVNIKYRTRLYDPEEMRTLISNMFYVEKREQRAGNI